jgi:hypothetical protein
MKLADRLDVAAVIAPVRRCISATPYVCRDPRTIPPRPWIYGRQFLRGSLSVIVSPGAVGKTTLLIGTALAMVTGRSLLDKTVWEGPKRVWLWNLEDSEEELAKLIEAARLHWRISEEDIADRLFVDSALDGAELCIATEDNTGFRILEPVVAELVDELKARQIDVLIVDPFVSSHRVSENNNSAIDAVAKKWARVGVEAGCAIGLVHHTRKLNGAEATAEGGRGAVSLINAARSVVALNRMTDSEGQELQIVGEDKRRFFRAYDDKANRAPPADKSDWYQLLSVELGNDTPNRRGDNIQVVVPWTPPDAFSGVTWEHLRDVQMLVGASDYRKDPQSQDWVGFAVGQVLGLDVTDRKAAGAARAKKLISTWTGSGALMETREKDANRDIRSFIRVGEPARPEGEKA